ncbi:uncharacterized protein At5g65660 isoform X2 [Arachis ipaensis]|uniref:Hydroxyproline-rich glycoprotein family protein n=1 Tax=Arachis hypogaea TaxID=3818 RepID=A0A444ZVT3_ARAHY|nr:uncharacterized protein At5g65660 isoform X2 [Arachis ipaensis]XP_025638675.1 uncharacterized protein At5g65660 isoform X2 [Arachis hypogaea]QHO03044.1 uncharacterized protein DS421_13g428970 [Arachis hypogaea]RYR18279.1 hypothetical protein Ahy_B03g062886 [Arachis hypogaea]
MEGQDLSPPQVDASRPSLGFPLGTALLLIIIFTLSGVFSCCYHWDKFRSFRQSQFPSSPTKSNLNEPKKQNREESLPVLMPGDQLPKFIAMPCPCQPPRTHKEHEDNTVIVRVEKPLQLPAIPLYL